MKLAELCHGIAHLLDPQAADLEITHITHDSRKAQHGSIFVAIEGDRTDGHDYISGACQLGAVCVLTGNPEKVSCQIPILKASEPGKAMALLARRLYQEPDGRLKVIGVTGTNGKTTCTYLINDLLKPLGISGRIGTLSYFNGVSEEKAAHTTPEAGDVFRLLDEMVANHCRFAAIEVSSHGLALGRVYGLQLAYGIFTNLSRDHLDFHRNMEDYFQAKLKMFSMLKPGATAIVNWDDPHGRRIQPPRGARFIRFGMSSEADLRFELLETRIDGSRFFLFHEGRRQEFNIPLLGRHNVYNFVAAVAVALSEGLSLEDLAAAAPLVSPIPGRTEPIDLGQDFTVMVDFAHTPDALEKMLLACRQVKPQRLIVVFGAGGDRDTSKRKEMGATADSLADLIFLTSDNPRNEDPESIMDMIAEGIARPLGPGFYRNWDRRAAIREAVMAARAGDLILIAGKGHETTQEIKNVLRPFNDRMVAEKAIRARLGGRDYV